MTHNPRSPEGLLQLGYGLVPMVAGLDKYTGLLADWEQYLSPAAKKVLPMRGRTFMRLVGAVEIAAGIAVLVKPRTGGFLVAGWLAAITANLLATGKYFDIAARDALLCVGAVALARRSPSTQPEATKPQSAKEWLRREAMPLKSIAAAVESGFEHAVR